MEQVAGLIAYYLSLTSEEKELLYQEHGLASLLTETVSSSSGFSLLRQLYTMIKPVIPDVILRRLPVEGHVPLHIPTIPPKEMKRLLASVATKGAISDLPPRTPNLLVYNNATSS